MDRANFHSGNYPPFLPVGDYIIKFILKTHSSNGTLIDIVTNQAYFTVKARGAMRLLMG